MRSKRKTLVDCIFLAVVVVFIVILSLLVWDEQQQTTYVLQHFTKIKTERFQREREREKKELTKNKPTWIIKQ